ncbi:cytochrome c class III [Anaeromyxobacter sp. K]|uniref:cytochrome c3 family protein n=1 Tax=Anaeromyxobacter sp. (strain K) TaxID=447217 RepID=UPI00017BE17D|nr:cytochrome c3 family protein [Anaeromyxobacter sp. K]ACG73385.1 cytochrome c class III [Anaeromyxobacter sp. K]
MKLLASIVAAFVLTGSAMAAAPAAPTVLKAKNGDVTFNHKTHAAVKCETCHATAAGGKIEGFGKEKAHATCIECHKKEAKGPAKCAECHKKA